MPIYEYKCKKCGEVTAELRLMSKREEPLECPACGGEAEVILSPFSAGRGSSSGGAWGPIGGGCGST